MISLVEHPELDWNGRVNYLAARNEIRQWENYTADLLWVVASGKLQTAPPMPSEIWIGKEKKDNRSAKQIVDDLLDKLGGE